MLGELSSWSLFSYLVVSSVQYSNAECAFTTMVRGFCAVAVGVRLAMQDSTTKSVKRGVLKEAQRGVKLFARPVHPVHSFLRQNGRNVRVWAISSV